MAKGKKLSAPKSYPRGRWSRQALKVLQERYLQKDKRGKVIETPEGMVYRVATEAVRGEEKYGVKGKEREKAIRAFYSMIVNRYFIPNSPTLMNAGKGNKLQYSACFVLPVGDSMEEIFEAIKRAAIIHKSGGGTGFSFSRLRPQGMIVGATRGVASGPVSFMRIFDSATNEIKQGGMRRGANMGILRVDHPDILEFIRCKREGGITNFNISVGITEAFMKAVEKGGRYWLRAGADWHDGRGGRYKEGERIKQISAKKVFAAIVESAHRSGDPGLVFLDRINGGSANPVPSMGPVEATNPCLVGSTLITTDRGLIRLSELVDQERPVKVLVDNRVVGREGYGWWPVSRFLNKGKKEIWRLTTKSGFELKGTADHRIFTQRGWVELGQLKPGNDKVFFQGEGGRFSQDKKLPLTVQNNWRGENGRRYQFNLPKEWSRELGQILGWLVGDGWLRKDKKDSRVGFSFGKKDGRAMEKIKKIMDNWYGREVIIIKRDSGVWHLSYHSRYLVEFFRQLGVKPVKAAQKQLPEAVFTATPEAVIGFLQGLFTADGTVGFQADKSSKYIRLTSKSRLLLRGVQVLLINLGIFSRIYDRSRLPRKTFSYTTKAGEKKEYLNDGVCFELNISGKGMDDFVKKVGFLGGRHQAKLTEAAAVGSYSRKFADPVSEVKNTGEKETVYDLAVPGVNSFFAQGLAVHNCGEQPLYPNEACNLGSINLGLMVKGGKIDWAKLKKTVHLAARFLDDIIDVNPFPLAEIAKTVQANRRIGLGVMGWADLLFELKIPYDSREAVGLAKKVMRFINKEGHRASRELAKKRGAFPNFKKSIYKDGPPLRNATVTTIAPTGSISLIANCSSGIEPVFALAFVHRSGERRLKVVNSAFEKAIAKLKHGKEVLDWACDQGSLKEAPRVSAKTKRIFVTAHEIGWRWHIRAQAAFQAYVDNAVSKTINMPARASVADVRQAYLLAYKLGCRGITVFRDGCKGEQVLTAGTGDKKKEKKAEAAAGPVKRRPMAVQGFTYRVKTPVGTAFVTVNHNGKVDHPMEVFVNVGRAGSDLAADAEAIGRLISLCLRISSPGLTSRQVAELVVDQLRGIGGGGAVGFGKDRVRSLADGVAKAIQEHVAGNGQDGKEAVFPAGHQPALVEEEEKAGLGRDICPKCGDAGLIYEEGCARCLSCSFSKC